MKWILRLVPVVAGAAAVLFSAPKTYARELCPPGFDTLCQIKLGEDSSGVIGAIMVILFLIAILTSLGFFLFGAFRWVTSAGDQGKTQQARSTLIASLVGLVIALSAFFIINLVMYFFTGQALGGIEVPCLVEGAC